MCDLLNSVQKKKRKTVTLDCGSEFFAYRDVERQTGIKVYFAHPHSPWERGTNENTNGLLREYIPKHSRKFVFSEQLLAEAVHKLNMRPRKCLGWLSPYEVFLNKSLHFY